LAWIKEKKKRVRSGNGIMGNKKKGEFAIAFLLLLLLYFLAVTVASAVNAVVVSEVTDLRDYVPRGHSYTHGDTLKVYVEMRDVNHEGFAFVDFAFIIEDQKGHVVATDTLDVERRDYVNDVYVVYTKKIPDWWLYGKYELDIHAYDRVDDAMVRVEEQKIEGNRSSPEKLIEDDEFELVDDVEDVTKSILDSRKEKTRIIFFVHPEEIIEIEKPPEVIIKRPVFTVTDVSIDKFKVMPGETVSISVTVKNEGMEGTEKVTLVINDEKEAEESVTLDRMESKTLIFHVKKDLPGTYKVTIPGTDIVKLFFVEESRGKGEEGTGNSTSTLSALKKSEAGVSPGSGLAIRVLGNGVGIAFIAIAIVVFVLALLRFHLRSKQLSFN
jgi:hypothetical protein